MKRLSVKQKLTIWITLLMLLLVTVVLAFLMAVSSSVVTGHSFEVLDSTLRGNLTGVSRGTDGALAFSEDFSFTQNGVYTLIYNADGALLAGQPPLSFPEGEPFENGHTRLAEGAGEGFYVLDFWLPFGHEDGVWVRGVTPAPDTADILGDLANVGPAAAAAGRHRQRAGGVPARALDLPPDRPHHSRTPGAISEGRDLSQPHRPAARAGRDQPAGAGV